MRVIISPWFERFAFLLPGPEDGEGGVTISMSLPAGCGARLRSHPLWSLLPEGWSIHLAGGETVCATSP